MRRVHILFIVAFLCFALFSCDRNETDGNNCSNGHDYGSWTLVVAPTCEQEGLEQRVCSRDSSHKEERSVPKTNHNFVNGVCSQCGQLENEYRGEYYDADNFDSGTKTVSKTTLVTYDGPEYLDASSVYDVEVNGHNIFVYDTRINHDRQFSWTTPTSKTQFVTFDFEGSVEVKVIANEVEKVSSAILRPQIYGVVPKISGNVITLIWNITETMY